MEEEEEEEGGAKQARVMAHPGLLLCSGPAARSAHRQ